MNELFVVLVAHCSGGHGDTFGFKGLYLHFKTALEVARNIEKDQLRITGPDHGAFIFKGGLNKVYKVKDSDTLVFARRYRSDGTWTEEWYDENLHSSTFVTAEDIRQSVIDQLL